MGFALDQPQMQFGVQTWVPSIKRDLEKLDCVSKWEEH